MPKSAACVLGVLLLVSVFSCRKEPEPEIVVTRVPASWIGVGLDEKEDYDSKEIRGKNVIVTDVIPATPADGVLKPGDVIVTLGARSPASAKDMISIVQKWPTGTTLNAVVRRDGKDVAVNLRPTTRPTTEALLERLYLGKPLPPFPGEISVAETDGRGGIVPGSQCVTEKDRVCPPIGKNGATNVALGKATAVLFWTRWSRDNDYTFAALRQLAQTYGDNGLRIVAITADPPYAIPAALSAGENLPPPMTVVSVYYGGYGGAAYAAMTFPTVLLLDEKGTVRAIVAGSGGDLSGTAARVLPQLLGIAQDTQE